jgi:hypothetical protein
MLYVLSTTWNTIMAQRNRRHGLSDSRRSSIKPIDILTMAMPKAQKGCAIIPQKAEFSMSPTVNLDRSPPQEGKTQSTLLKKRDVLMTTRIYVQGEQARNADVERSYIANCADVIVGQHAKHWEAASP